MTAHKTLRWRSIFKRYAIAMTAGRIDFFFKIRTRSTNWHFYLNKWRLCNRWTVTRVSSYVEMHSRKWVVKRESVISVITIAVASYLIQTDRINVVSFMFDISPMSTRIYFYLHYLDIHQATVAWTLFVTILSSSSQPIFLPPLGTDLTE